MWGHPPLFCIASTSKKKPPTRQQAKTADLRKAGLLVMKTLTDQFSVYLCGVEGAEREGSLRKEGGESGAPSSLSPRTAHLNAIGGPI